MANTRLYVLIFILISILIFFQYRLWFDTDGMRNMLELKKMLSTQMTINDKLKKRNEELLFQIQHMQTGSDASESRARNELGMVKKGETFYQIVQKDQA